MGQYSPSVVNNTIQLDIGPTSKYDEAVCNEDLDPGQFLVRDNIGRFERMVALGIPMYPIIAVENGYGGGTMWETYVSGSRVMARILRPGDVVLTRVQASVLGITYQAQLTYYSDGWLTGVTSADQYRVAICDEYDPSPIYPRWTKVKML